MNAVKSVTLLNSIMLSLLLIWSFTKPSTHGGVTATGGSAEAKLSISGNNVALLEKAKRRGYFTASEYAQIDGVSLETVYRHANSGRIVGAEKIEGKWRIPLPLIER